MPDAMDVDVPAVGSSVVPAARSSQVVPAARSSAVPAAASQSSVASRPPAVSVSVAGSSTSARVVPSAAVPSDAVSSAAITASLVPRHLAYSPHIPAPLLTKSGHYLLCLYTSLSCLYPLADIQAALDLFLKLKVEGKVFFKGKEEKLSLGFEDAVDAYPSLGGLVSLLPGGGGRPAWDDDPMPRNLNYPTLVLQAGLVRDVGRLMAVSRSRVYEGERKVVIPLDGYQGLMQLNIQTDQFLANLAGL